MNIIIVGGGAAGLMAAVTAAKAGATVTILEHNDKPGRKILASGNGRCNLTNITQQRSCYRSTNPDFSAAVVDAFNLADTLSFFTKAGIYTKNKNGWIYPYSEQATAVLEVLLMECAQYQVKIKTREEVVEIKPQQEGFVVVTKTWKYSADRVIIAAGSPASAVTGASDSGYQLAVALGHSLVSPLPALVSLRGAEQNYTKWAGVRMECAATLVIDEEIIADERGEVQFTDYGISGIPVFQLSRDAVQAVDEQKKVLVMIDFMPDFTVEQLTTLLETRLKNCPYKSKEKLLIGLLPAKLIPIMCREIATLEALATRLKAYPVPIKGSHSMAAAQVCSGGVKTQEVASETMQSKLCPGLFFAGEVLDVDGRCGGYNLQWAWSSGAVAGAAAATV